MKLRALRYAGSKFKYIERINSIIEFSSKRKVYCEPFMGSASIFLNLKAKFDKYFLFDIDPNIVKIFNSLKNISLEELNNFYQNIQKEFGDFGNSKDSYYEFRKMFNEIHYRKNTIEEGVYLFFLINSCINSMARFGPNGFNQGFGCRDFSKIYIKENYHPYVLEKLKNSEINCSNFFDISKDILNEKEALFFLDPPYHYLPSYSYKGFDEDKFLNFIEIIKTIPGDVIYTDIIHDKLKNWQMINLRKMINISPNKKSEETKEEVLFTNFLFKEKKIIELF